MFNPKTIKGSLLSSVFSDKSYFGPGCLVIAIKSFAGKSGAVDRSLTWTFLLNPTFILFNFGCNILENKEE